MLHLWSDNTGSLWHFWLYQIVPLTVWPNYEVEMLLCQMWFIKWIVSVCHCANVILIVVWEMWKWNKNLGKLHSKSCPRFWCQKPKQKRVPGHKILVFFEIEFSLQYLNLLMFLTIRWLYLADVIRLFSIFNPNWNQIFGAALMYVLTN